jgi:hypothetical protein
VHLLWDLPSFIILLSLEVCNKSIFVREVGGMNLFRGVHSTVREGQGPQLGLRMKQEHMETCFIRIFFREFVVLGIFFFFSKKLKFPVMFSRLSTMV